MLRYAAASRSYFVWSALVTVVQTAVIIAFATVLTRVLTGAIDGEPVARLSPWLAAGAGIVLLRGALTVATDALGASGAARAQLQLRSALTAAVRRLGPAAITAHGGSARLAVLAGHGLEALDAYFGRYLPQLVASAITMPVLVVAITLADPVSGLIVVLTLPLIPIFMVLIGLATRAVQRRQLDTLGRLAARFADTVNGLGTLKLFGRQRRAASSIERVTQDYKRETMSVLRVSFLSGFALEFLASISVAVVAVTIGLRLLGGELTLGIGLFVLLLAPEAFLPLRQVGAQFHAAAEGMAATEPVFALLDAARGAGEARLAHGGELRAPAAAPALTVRGLRVHRGPRLLPPVDLTVAPGEITLLRGPSGAGKSSVVAALLGFAEYDGEIRLGASPVPNARAAIAWAGQQPGLIAGTVAANVALGDPAPDAALVASCLRDAHVDRDVDGAQVLGVRGDGLSGGQAQRVALARALYRLRSGRAAILVLDEPTSALDAHTERAVWQTLRSQAAGGAGILLISHRRTAATIANRSVTLAPLEATV
ncbi:ABC transporter ATP-binding protein [Microbacterium mangrovi]|uniref:ABC transporter ATP-binding protein n=1 Tax=Microbacterium mangrovi TaxID=1348253 RepID=A0A0B2ABB1_9MICO|nr:ABC transporter ATP-binding protein [Microbacterium mangrovi]